MGALCTFVGHLARCGTVGGDLSRRLARVYLAKFCMVVGGVE